LPLNQVCAGNLKSHADSASAPTSKYPQLIHFGKTSLTITNRAHAKNIEKGR
jgi:hypothetical protein